MSSRVKAVGKVVRERQNEIATQAMEELFSLPLSKELKLRKLYRKRARRFKRQQKWLAKVAKKEAKALEKERRRRERKHEGDKSND